MKLLNKVFSWVSANFNMQTIEFLCRKTLPSLMFIGTSWLLVWCGIHQQSFATEYAPLYTAFGLSPSHSIWLQLNVLATLLYAGVMYAVLGDKLLIRLIGLAVVVAFYVASVYFHEPIEHLKVTAGLTFALFLVDYALAPWMEEEEAKVARRAAVYISLPVFVTICILIGLLQHSPPGSIINEVEFTAGAVSAVLFFGNFTYTLIQFPNVKTIEKWGLTRRPL